MNEDKSEGRPLLTQAWMWSKARLHMVLPLLSHMVFGLLPPVLCGLSFRESNDRENKMMDVASASLACIALLALGKVMATEEPWHTSRLSFTTLPSLWASSGCHTSPVYWSRGFYNTWHHWSRWCIGSSCFSRHVVLSFSWCTYVCLGLILKSQVPRSTDGIKREDMGELKRKCMKRHLNIFELPPAILL